MHEDAESDQISKRRNGQLRSTKRFLATFSTAVSNSAKPSPPPAILANASFVFIRSDGKVLFFVSFLVPFTPICILIEQNKRFHILIFVVVYYDIPRKKGAPVSQTPRYESKICNQFSSDGSL